MAPLLDRDGILLLSAKFLRAFAYGVLTVSLVVYLADTGFAPFQIGLVLSLAVAGGGLSTVLVILFSDRFGRRRSLLILSLLMALSGTILALPPSLFLVGFGVLIGSISLTGGETGPFLSLEQSIIPEISGERERNRVFSVYNFIGYAGLALGSLAGVLPKILRDQFGYSVRDSFLPVFLVVVLVALFLAIIYLGLSVKVEAIPLSRERIGLPRRSRSTVFKLSLLFSLNSFGGGFVIQSFISLWFYLRFQTELSSLSLIIAAGQAVTAVSILVAGPVADRFGLLNTMVYTHIVSNVFLASIAFAPTLPIATGLYLARQSLSQMDVPTRQAYTMAMVPMDERTSAAGLTTLSRNLSQSISPSIAGYLLQTLTVFPGTPFLFGGGIKIVYDLLLYRNFRHVTIPKETKPETV